MMKACTRWARCRRAPAGVTVAAACTLSTATAASNGIVQMTALLKLMRRVLFSFLLLAPKFYLSISNLGAFQVFIFSKSGA